MRYVQAVWLNSSTQLTGGLSSTSDLWKKLHITINFIAFSILYGYLWPPHKISGVVSLASREHFVQEGPDKENLMNLNVRLLMSDAIKIKVNTVVYYYCIYFHFYCFRRYKKYSLGAKYFSTRLVEKSLCNHKCLKLSE